MTIIDTNICVVLITVLVQINAVLGGFEYLNLCCLTGLEIEWK